MCVCVCVCVCERRLQCSELTHVGKRRVGQGTDFIVAQVTEIKHNKTC